MKLKKQEHLVTDGDKASAISPEKRSYALFAHTLSSRHGMDGTTVSTKNIIHHPRIFGVSVILVIVIPNRDDKYW